MSSLYPLKFTPVFKDKIWGGQQIKTLLHQDFAPLPNCGEMWVLSGVTGNESVVSNGFLAGNTLTEMVEIYMDELLGEKVYERFGEMFPVLVKFIDTTEWLSVQVHPDDEMAQREHQEPFGKSEMWYVLNAGEKAELISGFGQETTREKFLEAIASKNVTSLLHSEKVAAGDVFYIPAGRIHAIGPEILLAEIQQTSDLTYRVYDYDRLGVDGLPRELHTNLGLDALDYSVVKEAKTAYASRPDQLVNLVDCPAFCTNRLQLRNGLRLNYAELDSFVIFICTRGAARLSWEEGYELIHAGEVILIPALFNEFDLTPEGEADFLQVHMSQ